MSTSGKLNDCERCEQIKNDASLSASGYSSDGEGSSYLGEEFGLDSFHLNLDGCKVGRSKDGSSTQNKTFSQEKVRDIERSNAMLVDRILYHNRRPNQYKSTVVTAPKVTSSQINRRRQQEKINRENELLLKKIQSVKPAVRYT